VSLEREQTLGVLHDCLISADGPDEMSEIGYLDTPHVKILPKKSIAKLPCNHKHMIRSHALHVAANSRGVKFISVAQQKRTAHRRGAAGEVPISAGACKITLYGDAKRDRVCVKPDE